MGTNFLFVIAFSCTFSIHLLLLLLLADDDIFVVVVVAVLSGHNANDQFLSCMTEAFARPPKKSMRI